MFRKAASVNGFKAQCEELGDQKETELMREVCTLVSNPVMHFGHFKSGFGTIATPLLLARESTLSAAQLALSRLIETGIANLGFIREREEGVQPDIPTGHVFKLNRGRVSLRQFKLRDEHDKPVSASVPLERSAFRRAVNWPRLANLNPADFRNVDALTLNFDPLRNPKRLAGIFAPLAARIASPFLKEVDEGSLEVSEGLLEGLRIHLLQPLKPWLAFECGELVGKLFPGDTLACFLVVGAATIQPPVIDETLRASKAVKPMFLLGCRFQFEFENFALRHLSDSRRSCFDCQEKGLSQPDCRAGARQRLISPRINSGALRRSW